MELVWTIQNSLPLHTGGQDCYSSLFRIFALLEDMLGIFALFQSPPASADNQKAFKVGGCKFLLSIHDDI